MGEMRFRDGGVGSREHYGGHGGDDLYGGSDRVFASGMQQHYPGHHAGGMQRGDRDFQRGVSLQAGCTDGICLVIAFNAQ